MRRKQPILLMKQGNVSVAKTIVTYFEKKVCSTLTYQQNPIHSWIRILKKNWKDHKR